MKKNKGYRMHSDEPKLTDSSDYNELKGEKRKVVYAVIGMLIAIGVLYSIVKETYSHVDDEIPPAKRVDYAK